MTAVPVESVDVLAWLDAQLAAAREQAVRAVDRAEALVEMRALALELANRARVTRMTAAQMFELPADERERAQLAALARRATEGAAA